jgi:hypothetical protein
VREKIMAKDFFEGIGGHEQFFKKPAKKKSEPPKEAPPVETPMETSAPLPSEAKLEHAKALHGEGEKAHPHAEAAKLEKEAGVVPHEHVNKEEPQPGDKWDEKVSPIPSYNPPKKIENKRTEGLNPGEKVMVNGYKGIIVRQYDGDMYEVKLPRGMTVVDKGDIEKIEKVAEK